MSRKLKSLCFAVFTACFVQSPMSVAQEAGDVAKGEKVFKKCSSCHKIGDGAENGVGPALTGIVGKAAGTVDGFKYGKSLLAAADAGLVWTEEELFDYLLDSKKFLRAKLEDKKAKSKMSFKLKKEQDRLDVIAYLKTFSPDAEASGETENTEDAAGNSETDTSGESSTTN